MDLTRTFYGEIRSIVRQETKYLRHYYGEVTKNDDPDGQGKIRVKIPELGWTEDNNSPWVQPRYLHSMIVPNNGEYVEVYFMAGEINRPVYMGQVHEIKGQLPELYSDKNDVVLYEEPGGKIGVHYNKNDDVLNIGKSEHKEAARKEDETISDSSTDSAFWSFMAAFYGVITGAPIPEPGSGSASALQAALAAAIAGAGGTPTSQTGKINEGSNQVKVGDK